MNMYKYKINDLNLKESGYLFCKDASEAIRRFLDTINDVMVRKYLKELINLYGGSDDIRITIKVNNLELLLTKVKDKNKELNDIIENDIFQMMKTQIQKEIYKNDKR